MKLTYIILFVLIVECFSSSAQQHIKHDKILLKDVKSLIFRKNEWSTYRRTESLHQLNCVEKHQHFDSMCQKHSDKIHTIFCKNVGFDGSDVNWECETTLDSHIKLGNIDVACEGYGYPDDPYILVGSCGIEYELYYVPQTQTIETIETQTIETQPQTQTQIIKTQPQTQTKIIKTQPQTIKTVKVELHNEPNFSAILILIFVVVALLSVVCSNSDSSSTSNSNHHAPQHDHYHPQPTVVHHIQQPAVVHHVQQPIVHCVTPTVIHHTQPTVIHHVTQPIVHHTPPIVIHHTTKPITKRIITKKIITSDKPNNETTSVSKSFGKTKRR